MPSPRSPSGLATLALCARKFAWAFVDNIEGEGTYYTQFGTKVHAHVEAYYKRGVMPDMNEPEGNCAVALLAHLPPPQPGMKIEERRFVGRFEGSPDLTLGPAVWDHKTTSDLKWAKTPGDLLNDLQACLYAWFVMQETGELRVRLQWNYVTRDKRPRVLPVIQEATFGTIAHTLDRAHQLADEADRILSQGIHALDLPPNLLACDMYGGCAHRTRCGLGSGDRMTSLLLQQEKEENMTNAADFQAQMNAAHPPAPAPSAPSDPTAGWTRQNGYRLNPGTNTWEPDVPAAPPAPPAPVAVPINPPAPPAPPAVSQAAPPAPPAPGIIANLPPTPEAPKRKPGRPPKAHLPENASVSEELPSGYSVADAELGALVRRLFELLAR